MHIQLYMQAIVHTVVHMHMYLHTYSCICIHTHEQIHKSLYKQHAFIHMCIKLYTHNMDSSVGL